MSGSGNATVRVTGATLWLRNWYLTVTVSGVIARSSDSIATSAERVKTRPPIDSSAAESFAAADEPRAARQRTASGIRSAARVFGCRSLIDVLRPSPVNLTTEAKHTRSDRCAQGPVRQKDDGQTR